MQTVIIYTDGGARGNPGPAGAGWVIVDDTPSTGSINSLQAGSGRLLLKSKKYLGERQTNNWAEYEAVALALSEAKEHGLIGQSIEVRMDSKLVVEQIMGHWRIKEPSLKSQAAKVRELLKDFPDYRFVHIPREENSEADRLVNEAIDEAGV